jgi:hypothetical protein
LAATQHGLKALRSHIVGQFGVLAWQINYAKTQLAVNSLQNSP